MCARANRSRSRSIPSRASRSRAMSTACRRRADSNSRCCRPTTPPGNFTKIVQRVPVKIVLDDKALAGRLRPGNVGRGDRRHQGEALTGRRAAHDLPPCR